MKTKLKILLILIASIIYFSQQANAETFWYRATELAVKPIGCNWTDWEGCNVEISINNTSGIIDVYSKRHQTYLIQYELESPYDNSGVTYKFQTIDNNNIYCIIRLRVESNGNSQFYVDYSDVTWVYNIIKM